MTWHLISTASRRAVSARAHRCTTRRSPQVGLTLRAVVRIAWENRARSAMRRRAFVFLALAAVPPSYGWAAGSAPVDVVTAIYKIYAGPKGDYQAGSLDDKRVVAYFSASLRQAVADMFAREDKTHEAILDFDPVTDSAGPAGPAAVDRRAGAERGRRDLLQRQTQTRRAIRDEVRRGRLENRRHHRRRGRGPLGPAQDHRAGREVARNRAARS